MTLKERIAVTRRGYRMLGTYCPGLIRAKVLSAAAEALSPFVTIWCSAGMINEIAGSRDAGRLILLVLFLCVITADISAVLAGSSRIGRLNVSISSLEESNSLLRQELSRAGDRAFTLTEAGGQESGWIVLPSSVPEE